MSWQGVLPSGPTSLPSPRVELGSSPLPSYRSTFGASSEDLARHKGQEYDVLGIEIDYDFSYL